MRGDAVRAISVEVQYEDQENGADVKWIIAGNQNLWPRFSESTFNSEIVTQLKNTPILNVVLGLVTPSNFQYFVIYAK